MEDLAEKLLPLTEHATLPKSIVQDELAEAALLGEAVPSLWRSVKHLVSSDVRESLRKDPLLKKIDVGLRRLASLGGRGFEDRLRHSIEGPIKIDKVCDTNQYSSRYNAMQLRGVTHRIDRARDVLGYSPQLSFDESMSRFRQWYAATHGFGSAYWPLATLLDEI